MKLPPLVLRPPVGVTVEREARDWHISLWPITIADRISNVPDLSNRIGIVWDEDRDDRLLLVLTALHYMNRKVRSHVVALTERKGVITCWYAGMGAELDDARTALQAAADAALRPHDHWTVNPLIPVKMKDGVMDWDSLSPDDLLHGNLPRRFNLGLVVS